MVIYGTLRPPRRNKYCTGRWPLNVLLVSISVHLWIGGINMARNKRLLGWSFATAMLTAALLVLSVQTVKAQSAGSDSSANQAQSQASQTANTSAAKPNLAGTWTLNQKQSDDPRQKMQEAMNANGNQNGSSDTNPGRTGGRRGRGGRGGGMMMRQFSQLTISQTDKGLNVAGATGRLIATTEPQSNDQNAQDNQDNGGGMMRMRPAEAKWQGSQLVATSDMFGSTITRTFELSPDGKQLYMTTKIESQRFSQPVSYRFVYDAGKPGDNSQ